MKQHILIVEDDNDMREVIAFFLQAEGYHVTQATNGTIAIEHLHRATEQGDGYDVVLTDIVMEGTDGIEVMNVARSQPDGPEVILLTGHGSLDTAISAVRAGAFDYLLKPCDLDRLLGSVVAASRIRMDRLHSAREAETGRKLVELAQQFPSHKSEKPIDTTRANDHTRCPPPASPHAPDPFTDRYLEVGDLRLDTYRHEVWFKGTRIHLSPTEYATLAYLAATPGRVATFLDIARHTRSYHIEEAEARDLVRGPVRNLRKKLEPHYIVSVRGVGFLLTDPNEATSPTSTESTS